MAEFARGREQGMRRANLVGKVVGVAAAAGRKDDDGGDFSRIGIGQRQRAPSAGGVADDHRAIAPDEGLPAQIGHGVGYFFGGRASRTGVVGFVAAVLILQIFTAGCAMARTFRHQHGKPPRHQKRRQGAVFRLRHLRAKQHVLGRRMRDDREAKRAFAGRAKQQSVRCDVRIGRRHQPGLRPVGFGFRTFRPERTLCGGGGRPQRSQQKACKKRPKRQASNPHEARCERDFPGIAHGESHRGQRPVTANVKNLRGSRPFRQIRPQQPFACPLSAQVRAD